MIRHWTDLDRFLGWPDFNRNRKSMETFQRQMNRLFKEWDRPKSWDRLAGWPRTNLYDKGAELIVTAEVPGLSHEDLEVSVHMNVLSLSGERKIDVPEGYSIHRRERSPFKFSRSFALPYKVDPEKTMAQVKDGILTITLAKAPEAQPKQISVQAR